MSKASKSKVLLQHQEWQDSPQPESAKSSVYEEVIEEVESDDDICK